MNDSPEGLGEATWQHGAIGTPVTVFISHSADQWLRNWFLLLIWFEFYTVSTLHRTKPFSPLYILDECKTLWERAFASEYMSRMHVSEDSLCCCQLLSWTNLARVAPSAPLFQMTVFAADSFFSGPIFPLSDPLFQNLFVFHGMPSVDLT